MKIELIVIGNEVLSGFTVNTNAAFIGQQLLKHGYSVDRQTTIPDDEAVMHAAFEEALARSDVVITTGGLGPTVDDVTRKAAAKLFDSPFHLDKKVEKDLIERFGKKLDSLKDQSTVPAKAEIFLNTVGTAPGFAFRKEKKALLMVPGVPDEMHPMFTDSVLPWMEKYFTLKERAYRKVLNLFELPELAVDPFLRELQKKYPRVEFGIYPSIGLLTVHVKTRAANAKEAMDILEPPYRELEVRFATNCYASETGKIEESVHHLFRENGWTLSVAESCTGGSVAARLTQIPGASAYFLGSIVAYANAVKTSVLHVPEALIQEKGAVSQEVVEAMVLGALQVTRSDFALAVTGIAGPEGGTETKPVGMVWCAVCRRGEKPHAWKLQGRGSRERIIVRSVNSLLAHLLIYIKETALL